MNYTKIIAGVMNWGAWGKSLSENEMSKLIDYCVGIGITTFDHADIYGGYTMESAFGQAFKKCNVNRDMVQLISKCGIQYVTENRNNKVKHYNYDKEYIIWSVTQSLKNLGTDYLDVLLLHRPSPLMNAEEIAEAITTLKKSGMIKDFGVSNFTPLQTDLINTYCKVSVNQIECSLTQYSAMLDGSLDYMQGNAIIPMAWSPLGNYFKENSPQNERIHGILEELLLKYNATADQLLLAWLLKHPSGIHPVVGTTSFERLKNAYKAQEINLETEDWFALLVASQGHKVL